MSIPDAFPVPESEDPFLRVIQLQVYTESPADLVLANEMLARVQALLSIQSVGASIRILTVEQAIKEDMEEEAETGDEE